MEFGFEGLSGSFIPYHRWDTGRNTSAHWAHGSPSQIVLSSSTARSYETASVMWVQRYIFKYNLKYLICNSIRVIHLKVPSVENAVFLLFCVAGQIQRRSGLAQRCWLLCVGHTFVEAGWAKQSTVQWGKTLQSWIQVKVICQLHKMSRQTVPVKVWALLLILLYFSLFLLLKRCIIS